MLKLLWIHIEVRARFAAVFGLLALLSIINPVATAAIAYRLLEEQRWMDKALRRYIP